MSLWANFKLGLAGISDELGITTDEAAQVAADTGTGTVDSNTAAENADAGELLDQAAATTATETLQAPGQIAGDVLGAVGGGITSGLGTALQGILGKAEWPILIGLGVGGFFVGRYLLREVAGPILQSYTGRVKKRVEKYS